MKAPKEIRQYVNNIRKNQGKSNGVIRFLWDWPKAEVKLERNKKIRSRFKIKIEQLKLAK